MKIVLNKCYGGFSLSKKACEYLGITPDRHWNISYAFSDHTYRSDPRLVKCVEFLGEEASGCFANLVVVEIPDDIQYTIDNRDGFETVHEVHKSW